VELTAVRRYLEALCGWRDDDVERQLAELRDEIAVARGVERLMLVQRRLDLESGGRGAREREFVRHAAGYSRRKGITWAAWRQIGVPAAVLRRAKVPQGR